MIDTQQYVQRLKEIQTYEKCKFHKCIYFLFDIILCNNIFHYY